MTVGSRYRINEKQVVYQSFDEEIISINLDLGTYYTPRDAGVEFWSWIAKGYDWAAIRQAIGETYLGDPVAIEGECLAFVDKLAENGLVTCATDGAEQDSIAPGEPQALERQLRIRAAGRERPTDSLVCRPINVERRCAIDVAVKDRPAEAKKRASCISFNGYRSAVPVAL